MANGWLLNWARIATRERESLEAHCVENLFVVFVCVLSLIDAKRQFLYPQGANDQVAPPHYILCMSRTNLNTQFLAMFRIADLTRAQDSLAFFW